MPLTKRAISPVDVSLNRLPASVKQNELQCVANGTLANLVRQLSSLSKHAEDIFGELFLEAVKIEHKANNLTARIERLATKVTQLDSNVEEVSLQELHLRKPFKSSSPIDQQSLSRHTLPAAMSDCYSRCDRPPELDKLNVYRDDGKNALKFYTDPDYFYELWAKEMLNYDNLHPKRHKNPSKPKNPGDRKRPKNPRQPSDHKRKQVDAVIERGEYIHTGPPQYETTEDIRRQLPRNNLNKPPAGMNRPESLELGNQGPAANNIYEPYRQYPNMEPPRQPDYADSYGQTQTNRLPNTNGGGVTPQWNSYERPVYQGQPSDDLRLQSRTPGDQRIFTPLSPDASDSRSLSRNSPGAKYRPSQAPPAPPQSNQPSILRMNPYEKYPNDQQKSQNFFSSSLDREELPPPPSPPVSYGSQSQSASSTGPDFNRPMTASCNLPPPPADFFESYREERPDGGGHSPSPDLPPPPSNAINGHPATGSFIPQFQRMRVDNASPSPPNVAGKSPPKGGSPLRKPGVAPPPPPPPPPMGNGSAKTVGNVVESQSTGNTPLTSSAEVDSRTNLLKAIKDGIKLKKTEEKREKERVVGPLTGGHDVAQILARRMAMEMSESDNSENESDFDDDWD